MTILLDSSLDNLGGSCTDMGGCGTDIPHLSAYMGKFGAPITASITPEPVSAMARPSAAPAPKPFL